MGAFAGAGGLALPVLHLVYSLATALIEGQKHGILVCMLPLSIAPGYPNQGHTIVAGILDLVESPRSETNR